MRELKITMIKENYHKEGRRWILDNTEKSNINEEFYNNIINSKKFFTNLGGYERHIKSYTCNGYIVTHINSLSPDRTQKTVRDFSFRNYTQKEVYEIYDGLDCELSELEAELQEVTLPNKIKAIKNRIKTTKEELEYYSKGL